MQVSSLQVFNMKHSGLVVAFTLPLLFGAMADLLIFGDKNRTVFSRYQQETEYYSNGEETCRPLPEVPFTPWLAVGLKDNQGRAMLCGGSMNPNPKSCHIFDPETNAWIDGPELKRKRVGASATCLPDGGGCWIFGGKKKSYTEWYNPDTGKFEMGVKMPVNSVHGLCTDHAPSGLIYIAAVRQPGTTMVFTFDPKSRIFAKLGELKVEKRYPACGAFYDGTEEVFVVAGGGVNIKEGTDTVHIYNNVTSAWTDGPPLPYEVYGAISAISSDYGMLIVGGITPSGDKTENACYYISTSDRWDTEGVEEYNGVGRVFPIAIDSLSGIDHECTDNNN